ncbi:MAG: 2-oxo acid dehydrogenase subunit E2, partial [Chloroflexota bacterium]|nr:2-oxo acid dehydrogenase subunit E2 [Chloroflexota bacterium]
MADFLMPSLGADMESGTVVQWLVKPGDRVTRGDIVAVVDTRKAAIEVEIFTEGVVEQLLVPVGQEVPVGAVLATIRGTGEAPRAVGVAPLPAREAVAAPALAPAAAPAVARPAIAVTERRRISPLARRTAEKLRIDLDSVLGTGPQGAITQEDVERAAAKVEAAVPTPPTAEERQAAMRQAIAALMARSKREIPHYYLGEHIDVSRASRWLEEENLRRSMTERLLFSVLLLKAVALATREVPEMNGFWLDGRFQPGSGVHLGVAISLRQGGLIAPAIHDADRKTPDDLMAALRDLVKRTRAGILRSSEMSDPTLTVTNLGD